MPRENDQYSEEETARRRDAVVRRMEQTSGASTAKVAPLRPAGSTNGQDPSFAGAESAGAQSPAP